MIDPARYPNRFHLFAAMTLASLHSFVSGQDPANHAGFLVDSRWDPREIVVRRDGVGAKRRCEISVYEMVERGRRIRRLYQIPLVSERRPKTFIPIPGGRFLVTFDDLADDRVVWNGIVVYDILRKEHTVLPLRGFLSPKQIQGLGFSPFGGRAWFAGTMMFDAAAQKVHPSDRTTCQDPMIPFLEIDLRSRSVGKVALPKKPLGKEAGNRISIAWEWSMGGLNAPLPTDQYAYPTLLRGVVRRPADLTPLFGKAPPTILYYLFDARSGDYLACDNKHWDLRKGPKKGRRKQRPKETEEDRSK